MGTTQKIFTTTLWCAAVLAMLLVIALSSAKKPEPMLAITMEGEKELPTLFDLPTFKLLDQDGKVFTDEQLRGKPFVASFVFTHCAGPCPMIFNKMAAMQKTVPNANVKLVTFTVDPERDTPEALKEKSKQMGADEWRWYFLTGTNYDIEQLLIGTKQRTPGMELSPLEHKTQFFLFDAAAKCRGTYSSQDDDELARLTKDAQMLGEQVTGKQP